MSNIVVGGVTYELPTEEMSGKLALLNAAIMALAVQAGLAGIGARVYNNSNLSIPNTTITTLTFNSERYDSSGIHSASSNTDRLTLPYAGRWRIGANVRFATNGTGTRGVRIDANGSTQIGYSLINNAGSSLPTIIQVSTEWDFEANDYVVVKAQQTSGGSLNVELDSANSPEFWCSYLGA